jgi:hypothetical protein
VTHDPIVAEWRIDERDIMAGINASSGSNLRLVRWPIAFFIAYSGAALAERHRWGTGMALGSGLVMAILWLLINLAVRGSKARAAARSYEPTRVARLSIREGVIRHEWGSGHAEEVPLSTLTAATVGNTGILLGGSSWAYFIPERALGANEQALRRIAAAIPRRRFPQGAWFAIGLWAFAALVGAQAYSE